LPSPRDQLCFATSATLCVNDPAPPHVCRQCQPAHRENGPRPGKVPFGVPPPKYRASALTKTPAPGPPFLPVLPCCPPAGPPPPTPPAFNISRSPSFPLAHGAGPAKRSRSRAPPPRPPTGTGRGFVHHLPFTPLDNLYGRAARYSEKSGKKMAGPKTWPEPVSTKSAPTEPPPPYGPGWCLGPPAGPPGFRSVRPKAPPLSRWPPPIPQT